MCNYEVIADCDEYEVTMEDKEGFLFMHCEVHKFNKTVLKDLRGKLQAIKEVVREAGHVALFSQTKNERFIRSLDDSYDLIAEFTDESGDRVVGVAWPLD